ncbi:MAG: acylglycerol kinase family protein [Dehalococcoidia bacterium]|nr:acylglycerol kinase family protein [Dehalococcoidia bacterium]
MERILLIINRSSATGYGNAAIDRLSSMLTGALGPGANPQVEVVDDHPQAKSKTREFLASSDTPSFIIAGGGGGTLRAVIEAICEGSEPGNLPGRERIRISALRMGSGNVVARQFGVPRDPEAALKGIVANLNENRTAPCCIMGFEVGKKDSPPEVCYATTMGGFGQFGRSPGDLARWHRRLPTLRRLLAWLLGIERLNSMEYGLSLLLRFSWCALWPNATEVIEVRWGENVRAMRLLAGVVMNFPLKHLPFKPGTRVEEEALSLNFIPYPGRLATLFGPLSPKLLTRRALQLKLAGRDSAEVRLVNRDSMGFFLDEDSAVFHKRVLVRVAGTLAFVPGPDYHWQQ